MIYRFRYALWRTEYTESGADVVQTLLSALSDVDREDADRRQLPYFQRSIVSVKNMSAGFATALEPIQYAVADCGRLSGGTQKSVVSLRRTFGCHPEVCRKLTAYFRTIPGTLPKAYGILLDYVRRSAASLRITSGRYPKVCRNLAADFRTQYGINYQGKIINKSYTA